jgi:hypothetical protein
VDVDSGLVLQWIDCFHKTHVGAAAPRFARGQESFFMVKMGEIAGKYGQKTLIQEDFRKLGKGRVVEF